MTIGWIEERLAGGDIVLIDGAMGTELQARGVHMSDTAWSGFCVLDHGHVVRAVHEDYVRAGADIMITNTFASSRLALEASGHAGDVARINRLAVEAARRASAGADRPIAVAGSISTYLTRNDPPKPAKPAAERAAYREQAEALAEAGVDLIALEMMIDIEQTGYALEAALATGLPTWLGLSVRQRESDGMILTFDEQRPFEEAARAFAGEPVWAIGIMHSRVAFAAPALDILRRYWRGHTLAYPHSGFFKMPEWQFVDVIAPDDYAREAQEWARQGARLIGGCCGIGPAHIRRLKETLRPA